MMPASLGPYRVTGTLGEGGMGIVYAAHDDRLDRPLAVKVIRHTGDPHARERLWREARTAARLNHPGICQVYEVGEAEGALFIAMERLDGESLATRLARGAVPIDEACGIAQAVLGALEALHQRGLVHRDLKPSNIFLTPHGPKLLDFGLARPSLAGIAGGETALTMPGALVGTPQYMSPEHISGGRVDIRSDLFAVGVILYEMLAGRPPFTGSHIADVLHAICHESPRALAGSSAAVQVDAVIRRAVEKRPDARYASPASMAAALREAMASASTATATSAPVRPMLRIVVLPFRVLRPDADTDFLAYSLADAISCSLSGLESLVVRSPLAAARHAQDVPDLAVLAREADVDVVLTGTVLSAGGHVRVNAQLAEAPSGTLLWSQTSQAAMRDLFELQDELAQHIVRSLSVPLSARERGHFGRDVPASATAYELYLRANEASLDSTSWDLARGLYEQCVAADPNYAPAWARLGRCYRLLGKYGATPEEAGPLIRKAEDAFARALALNADLPLAHNLLTYLEVDTGRARAAMTRLLTRAAGRPADPDVFAGLVQACRYCGLLDASTAAYEHARRLDPGVTTSVAHTFWLRGDYDRAIEHDLDASRYLSMLSYLMQGRREEARMLFASRADVPVHPHLRRVVTAIAATVHGRTDAWKEDLQPLLASGFRDPEGWFYWALALLMIEPSEEGIVLLVRSIREGYHPVPALERLPVFDALRTRPEFEEALALARRARAEALAEFNAANGPEILGVREHA